MQNTAYKFAPIATEEKRIDVSLQDGDAVVKLSTWTDGLGWTVQKTLTLDPAMLDDLHRVTSAARVRMRSMAGPDELKPSKVLDFPTVA